MAMLTGKTAVVTGSTSGIGLAYARAMAKAGAIIVINLSSAFHGIRAVVPGMKKRGWGRIINTASAHSLVASPFKSAYVSAKHGIAGLTKTVALEFVTSEQVAALALFLCGDDAAQITGTNLSIDGGWTAE